MSVSEPSPRSPGNFRRLLSELRPFRKLQALCALLTILQCVFGFLPPLILGDIVNRLQRGEPIDTGLYLALIVGFAVVAGALSFAVGIATALLGQRFLLRMRENLYRHMQSLPLAYFDRNQTGKLISNVINDASTISGFITGNLNTMISDTVQLLLVLFVLFWISPPLALLSLAIAPLHVVNFRRFFRPLKETSEEIRRSRDAMFGSMQEKLAGVEVVKAYGMERMEAKSFLGTTRELMSLNVRQSALGGGLWTIADGLGGIGQGLVLAVGGMMAIRGEIGAGTLVMFLMYSIGYVYGPVVRFLMAIDPIARSQAALNRIFRTLNTEPAIADKPSALPMPRIAGRVRYEDVWFEYEPAKPVLRGVDLEVEPGEMVALVGFSGSGKTTMVNLLMRHYDPVSGRITVDGIDLRDARLLTYRAQIGYVLQESVVFNATVEENIRYGRPEATREQVAGAARAANLHDAIEALPGGYDAKLGEAGVSLSAGEKQRLSIARALLADPRILILDEATSALDSQTEALLQEALDRLLAGRTSFVIAHRLSTIVKADRIVVMEEGRITQRGAHAELLSQEGLYARLYRQQFAAALNG
jgi:subfamily B ATP-binding cassette protein MsbA